MKDGVVHFGIHRSFPTSGSGDFFLFRFPALVFEVSEFSFAINEQAIRPRATLLMMIL